ncbi:PREDICTED: uncharacterized protein LOC108562210 isoform X2 [Nicrophorus vespilloides]|uniref:Uncharacterized protein LOC108562210 isoform X2 n=1 Tax=Nicrophorus vespilloides TaxID=110193 RepID=A0ABM1MN16_NICVS|nr:PREDICTED: uncharacterized protein LOC108562210 isoform X2 [Nicrophorus vespilloides]
MKRPCAHLALVLALTLVNYIRADGKIPGLEILMPPSHTALSGDLHLQVKSSSFPPLLLQLSRVEGDATQTLATFPVLPEARNLALNSTLVRIPCGYFSKGGEYYVLLKKQSSRSNGTDEDADEVITRGLDVRWPMPQLSLTPEHVQTYPESPVMAILEFPEVVCPPVADSPASAIPEFWLELHYCGHSLLTCEDDDPKNKTNVQVLYSEQVRGFPGRRVLTLRCELFGLAGHYSLVLRPTAPTPTLPHTAAYVKADWSEQFVFNVHARSIFPCETHEGISVLFQYPSCILASGDRVRLFARLRANVASLAPPTTLEYVAEQRVSRGQHSLHFDCDLFSERYVEYCFVYVSQAITGAVADVRMDCVPTLPVTESESGGWGAWSEWTQCSSTCIGGTRNRYRFCDSPPPRYGAKFCEGAAVETEKCGVGLGNQWECFYASGMSGSEVAMAEMPEVQAEVGPYCRCGCVVHLGQAKPKRLLATSSQSCPGRTFWLIQADEEYIIEFRVEQFHLPCGTQWLKIRDGSSLSATLLADLTGDPESTPAVVNSTCSSLLLEFYSDEISTSNQFCGGGFLAHATQLRKDRNLTAIPIAQGVGVIPLASLKLTSVHIAAIFFLSGLIIATALLGAQYMLRYRKYQIAQADDQDSLADPTASCASLPLTMRASSNATLLSEVISLTRLRPHIRSRNKHTLLRESMDCEETEVTLAQEEETLSISSSSTITPQDTTVTGLPQSLSEYSHSQCEEQTGTLKRSSTVISEKDTSTEKELDGEDRKPFLRRFSHVSSSTSILSNACYSPAASMISTATIRSTNPKESKEKKNREKLLAGPGSDFSLAGPGVDLELDYYDYNVVNAGAAPGSYLGMDPAFLVWIPPLDESGEIIPEDPENILPKLQADPGSNKESPEEEIKKMSPKKSKKLHPLVIIENKSGSSESVKFMYERISPNENVNNKVVSIQLQEFSKLKLGSPVRVHKEKETKVEKLSSPDLDSNIKFADDDDVEETNQCNNELAYQDSNILNA